MMGLMGPYLGSSYPMPLSVNDSDGKDHRETVTLEGFAFLFQVYCSIKETLSLRSLSRNLETLTFSGFGRSCWFFVGQLFSCATTPCNDLACEVPPMHVSFDFHTRTVR